MSRFYKVSEIAPHAELASLVPELSTDEYESLRDDIREKGLFSALLICREGDKYVAIDGRHRLRAAEEVGLVEVPCTLLDGLDEDERIERGVRMNANRRNLTGEQKREMAAGLLRRWPDRASKWVARLVGMSDHTVTTVRDDLIARSQIAPVTKVVRSDGKTAPAKKSTGSLMTASKKPVKNGNGNGKSTPATSRLNLPEDQTPEDVVREAMHAFEKAEEAAEAVGMHQQTYSRISKIVALADDPNLKPEYQNRVQGALTAINSGGSVVASYESVEDIVTAKFGDSARGGASLDERFAKRMEKMEGAVLAVSQTCQAVALLVDVPAGIPADKREAWLQDLDEARTNFNTFYKRLKEA